MFAVLPAERTKTRRGARPRRRANFYLLPSWCVIETNLYRISPGAVPGVGLRDLAANNASRQSFTRRKRCCSSPACLSRRPRYRSRCSSRCRCCRRRRRRLPKTLHTYCNVVDLLGRARSIDRSIQRCRLGQLARTVGKRRGALRGGGKASERKVRWMRNARFFS